MLLSPTLTAWSNCQVRAAGQIFFQQGLAWLRARCGAGPGEHKTFPSEAMPCCRLALLQPG